MYTAVGQQPIPETHSLGINERLSQAFFLPERIPASHPSLAIKRCELQPACRCPGSPVRPVTPSCFVLSLALLFIRNILTLAPNSPILFPSSCFVLIACVVSFAVQAVGLSDHQLTGSLAFPQRACRLRSVGGSAKMTEVGSREPHPFRPRATTNIAAHLPRL